MTELEEITVEYEKLNAEKAHAAQTQLAELVQILSQSLAKNADQELTIARLTAAHEMQGESLVVLPRWMVSNMEDKLKAQAEQIELQGAEIKRLRGVIISYQAGEQ